MMSKRSSSACQRYEETMEGVTWEHVLEKTSLDVERYQLAIVSSDPESFYLRGLLSGPDTTWPSVLGAIVLGGILTQLSAPEDVRVEIEKAIGEIRTEGIGYKRRYIEKKCVSASALGDLTSWHKNQGTLQLCCHLPPGSKLHDLHVSLRIKAFGTFIDTMTRQSSSFMKLAVELVLVCSKAYAKEEHFRIALRPIIVKLVEGLGCSVDRMSSEEDDQRNAVTSDCTILFEIEGIRYPLASFELKRDIAGSSANPDIQNLGYFIRFQKKFQNNAAPLLLVSMAGFSHMQVYGGAWNGDNMCYDPLSLPLSLLFVPSDPLNTIQKVSVMLQGIHDVIVNLKEYYSKREVYNGPYFMHEKKLCRSKRMHGKDRCFEAENASKKAVVVKFTRSYGKDAQDLLSTNTLAPKVISHEVLSGGWHAVVMEKVDGVLPLADLDETTKSSLKSAVDILHSRGYVHGDLRPQNILVKSDRTVRILDFDWAGKCGSAHYPCDLNMSATCGWHKAVTPGGLIEKEHDLYQLHNMLKSSTDH